VEITRKTIFMEVTDARNWTRIDVLFSQGQCLRGMYHGSTAAHSVDPKSRGAYKMIRLTKVASVLLALLVLGGYAAAALAADATADEAAIRAISPAWAKAYNAGDAKAISALYAEQAVLLPPGAAVAKGKAAIEAYFAKDTAESAKAGVMFSLDPRTKSDVGVSGDLGWESGTYAVNAKSGAVVEVGKYLTVYKKSAGKWLIIRDTWNSDASPSPPTPAKK
jgi:uncharacterized protein (TIGR02246 family)